MRIIRRRRFVLALALIAIGLFCTLYLPTHTVNLTVNKLVEVKTSSINPLPTSGTTQYSPSIANVSYSLASLDQDFHGDLRIFAPTYEFTSQSNQLIPFSFALVILTENNYQNWISMYSKGGFGDQYPPLSSVVFEDGYPPSSTGIPNGNFSYSVFYPSAVSHNNQQYGNQTWVVPFKVNNVNVTSAATYYFVFFDDLSSTAYASQLQMNLTLVTTQYLNLPQNTYEYYGLLMGPFLGGGFGIAILTTSIKLDKGSGKTGRLE